MACDHRTLMRQVLRISICMSYGLGLIFVNSWGADETSTLPPAAKRDVDFIKDIQPLFKDHCYKCHGSSRQESGLRLDRRDDALNGGDGGPVFEAGKSEASKLVKYVAGVDPDVVMPPEGDKLSDDQIGLIRAWIDQGAKWPKE